MVIIDRDLYCLGRVLYINDYDFEDGSDLRNKYCIILGINETNGKILFCLPTKVEKSQSHLPLSHGCNNVDKFDCYYFEANRTVGIEGFSFPRNTHVYLRSNFKELEYPYLEIYNINEKMKSLDILKPDELAAFAKCAISNKMTPRWVKGLMHSIANPDPTTENLAAEQ
jgi:hypothetical protein